MIRSAPADAGASRQPAMTTNRRILCGVYAAIAVAALIATWSQNLAYLHSGGSFPGGFLQDLKVNAAARSITVDIVLFFVAAAVFMVIEARRLGIGHVWAYLVGGMLIAISVTFPLFLIARERRLATTGAPDPTAADVVLLSVFAALAAAGTIYVVS